MGTGGEITGRDESGQGITNPRNTEITDVAAPAITGRVLTDPEITGREIAAELAELRELLATLTPEQWEEPTLCERWRVRQVVGHLLGSYDPKLTVWKGLRGAVRSGFSFDRFLDADARRHETGRHPEELLAALAAVDITKGVATFVKPPNRLHEHLVHHQDIRRPLGAPRDVPEARLRTVLAVAVRPRGKRPQKLARGLSFRATDLEWTTGSGPAVEGPAEALILALAGRPVALAELTGAGIGILGKRLAP